MAEHEITFVIFTFNEAKRIERVIKNFQSYGKVLLADNNSTDGTIEIATSYGCDVFLRKEEYVFVENQQLVNQLYEVIKTDWIYWGFADEMLEQPALDEILKVVGSDRHDIITMDRKNYFYGDFCFDMFHARTFKLFKKGAIDFTDNVIHSVGKAVVPTERIYNMPDKYFIHHFISNTASSYLNVINRYTESELEDDSKPVNSPLAFFFLVIKYFIKNYMFNKGYKAGVSGVALTQLMIFYWVTKNLKKYEKLNNLNHLNIERTNDSVKDVILKKFTN